MVALCPSCESPFHFTQTEFFVENDGGGWTVVCPECNKNFKFPVLNPQESSTKDQWRVTPFYDWPGGNIDTPIAAEIVTHDLPKTKLDWKYDLSTAALFRCRRNSADLDAAAYSLLHSERDNLEREWRKVENWLLARGSGGGHTDKILVQVDVPCKCCNTHQATFYAKTRLGASATPLADRCLLIDVESASLEDRLNCLASKTETMDLLEKLLIRWHATADRIILATPFVGHQFMKSTEILGVWDWLFKNADAERVTLITRKATWTRFRNAHNESGVSFADLERYGLQEKVVSEGETKQDFHAKFFAGVSTDGVELLSGSANLVRGPSIENISFHRMSLERFQDRYLNVLKKPMPGLLPRQNLGDALSLKNGSWTFTPLPKEPWSQFDA